MQRKELTKGQGKRHLTILAPFPLRDAYVAALHIHVVETDGDQLADPNPGIEERFDQDHIREVAAVPYHLIKAPQLLLGWNVRQTGRSFWHLDLELLA